MTPCQKCRAERDELAIEIARVTERAEQTAARLEAAEEELQIARTELARRHGTTCSREGARAVDECPECHLDG